MNPTLTIFTPTFNRRHTLEKLFKSLCEQSNKDFLWLIIDDGSEDDTLELVKHFKELNQIRIEYHYQSNQGKPSAFNRALDLLTTHLIFPVDSDDYLVPSGIELVLQKWKQLENNNLTGIIAYKAFSNLKPITHIKKENVKQFKLQDGYRKFGLKGDACLIFKSEIVKKFRFPNIKGEKFVPEAYLYDLIDQDGDLLILREVIYIVQYLPDGYTGQINKLIAYNPYGYELFLLNRIRKNQEKLRLISDLIRLISIKFVQRKNLVEILKIPLSNWILIPIGYLLFKIRFSRFFKVIERNTNG